MVDDVAKFAPPLPLGKVVEKCYLPDECIVVAVDDDVEMNFGMPIFCCVCCHWCEDCFISAYYYSPSAPCFD